MAFGGAGPLHANALGKLLGAYPVIVPPSPGVLCAFGDATTVLRHEVGRSFIKVLRELDEGEILTAFNELLSEAKRVMRDDQGVPEQKQVHLHELSSLFGPTAMNLRPLIHSLRRHAMNFEAYLF